METLFAELEPLLYGLNYAVFLRVYRVPYHPDNTVHDYVVQALGSGAIVGGMTTVSGPEIIDEIEQSLTYVGDAGSGPKPSVMRSVKFKELLSGVLTKLNRVIQHACLLARFWLREGHPAYPVFWDFAFVIAGPTETLLIVGCSSD